MKTHWRKALTAAAGLAVLSGCASNAFVSSWQAPDASPLVVTGSKVAAIVMMKNEASRRAAEDALARELTARGAIGVPLYTILPNAQPGDEAAVRAALEQAGVAGAVTMRPVDRQQEIVSTPITYGGASYGGFYGGYYSYGWSTAWAPPVVGTQVRVNTIVSVETLVYSLRQNKLVWGGESQTTNPSSVDRLVKETAAKVAKELEQRGLIAG